MSREPKEFSALETRMGYVFEDRSLLSTALTHSSYGDGRRKVADNERLEFLGDRVLGLLTARMLYDGTAGAEGSMARRLNALVRKETCADIARDLGVPNALQMSKSEEKQGGREKTSILGDACEALLAAIYLDGGMIAAESFYTAHWKSRIDRVLTRSDKDPKTQLQELSALRGHNPPVYGLVERSGPDHRPEFIVSVTVQGKDIEHGIGRGSGPSKKIAQRLAAADLLTQWEASS